MTEEIRLHVKHGDAGTSACCRPKTDETTDYFSSKMGLLDIHIELQCGLRRMRLLIISPAKKGSIDIHIELQWESAFWQGKSTNREYFYRTKGEA